MYIREYEKCPKISNTFLFLFSSKMLVIKAGIHKMLVKIANRKDPDQTANLGLRCLSRPFKQSISVQNFRTFTVDNCDHCIFIVEKCINGGFISVSFSFYQ